MIEYLHGTITEKGADHVVMETNGIGYMVQVSQLTAQALQAEVRTKLLIHYAVSVDVRSGESKHILIGFASQPERSVFRQLVAVSGISATTAQHILSTLKPADIQSAVLSGNTRAFTAVKGVGPKLAEKIIAELKGKVNRDDYGAPTEGAGNTVRQEALSGLAALGFDRSAALKAINTVMSNDGAPDVETLIVKALKLL